MTTESKEVVTIDTSAIDKIRQGMTVVEIDDLIKKCDALKVDGVDDKKGYEVVYESQQIIKKHISNINKDHKAGKELVTSVGRRFDKAKKEMLDKFIPARDRLQEKRDIVEKEKARILKEEEDRKQTIYDERRAAIVTAGSVFDGKVYCYGLGSVSEADMWNLDDDNWDSMIAKVTDWKAEEDKKLAEQEAEKKAESEKQAKIAEENAKKQKELDDKQAELDRKDLEQKESQRKIDEEKRQVEFDKQKAIDVEKAKKQAVIDEQKRVEEKKIEDAQIEKESIKQAEKNRIESEKRKSDKQKILDFADVLESVAMPEVKAKKSEKMLIGTKQAINVLVQNLREAV